VIDVNPNADISADASVALAAGKAGYCYGKLGSRVLEFAARRHPKRAGAGSDTSPPIGVIPETFTRRREAGGAVPTAI
jgi:hypothetical protein